MDGWLVVFWAMDDEKTESGQETGRRNPWVTLPNAISALRLAAVPFLLYLGWARRPTAFVFLFAIALASDCIDGFIARKMKLTSSAGARLDSIADFATYICLGLCAWRLWPHIIERELPFVWAAVVAYITPTLLGVLRYGRLTSFHTWGAKLSAVVMVISTLVLITGGTAWPFRFAVPLMVLACMEEVAITLVLKEWQTDIPSLKHALQIRREKQADS